MLLLDVRVDIPPEHESTLNEWYYTHIPRLLSVPGYMSGRRYHALSSAPRYAALYEIQSASHVPVLVGDDPTVRHPLTTSEWESWDTLLAPYMTHGSINLYEPVSKAQVPILHGDFPIVEFRFDLPAADADAFVEHLVGECLPELTLRSDVRGATFLTASLHPSAKWLRTAPSALLLVECAGAASARTLVADRSETLHWIEHEVAGRVERTAYSLIARHWPWLKIDFESEGGTER
jgi:hypothetical protein